MVTKLPESLELKLLRGSDIKIDNHITIKQFTINEILDEIGYEEYYSLLYYFAYTPYDLRVQLYESNIIYNTLTHWELFLIFANKESIAHTEALTKSFEILFKLNFDEYYIIEKDGKFVLINIINEHEIDEFKFNYISMILREMNGLNSKELQFANNTALMYELERDIKRFKKGRNKSQTNLKSIISSVIWTGGTTFKDVWDLTLYQLYDGLNRKIKKEHYENIMMGIYTGNIKAESINLNKENWINKN